MFFFWCVPYLSHGNIIVISKPVPILSHSFLHAAWVYFYLFFQLDTVG